jgi:hypothetical protein
MRGRFTSRATDGQAVAINTPLDFQTQIERALMIALK